MSNLKNNQHIVDNKNNCFLQPWLTALRPHPRQWRPSWRWRWGRGSSPAGSRPAGRWARPSRCSPGRAAPTAARSGVGQAERECLFYDNEEHATKWDSVIDAAPPPIWIGTNRVRTHLLNAEAQDIVHVGGQQREQRVEGPVVAEVGHHDAPQGSGSRYGPPRDVLYRGGQLENNKRTTDVSAAQSVALTPAWPSSDLALIWALHGKKLKETMEKHWV